MDAGPSGPREEGLHRAHGDGSNGHASARPPRADRRSRVAQIEELARRVERRDRIQQAVEQSLVIGFPIACLVVASAWAAHRRLETPFELVGLASIPFLVIVLLVFLRKRSLLEGAHRIDVHYALPDTLTNALELARPKSTVGDEQSTSLFIDAVIHDALRRVGQVMPRDVVRIRPVSPGYRGIASAMLIPLATLVPHPVEDEEDPGVHIAAVPTASDAVAGRAPADMRLAEPLRQDLKALVRGEDVAAQVAESIAGVLDALEQGTIDRAEALERLAELEALLDKAEQDLHASLEEDPTVLAEGLRELGEQLATHEIMENVADALRKNDADGLEEALQEAYDKAAEDASAQEQLDKALQEAEKSLGKSAGENSSTAAELAEQERRLKREQKREKENESPEERERRLKRQQERVDELRRQHEAEKRAQEALDKLRRDAKDSQSSQSGGQKQNQSSQGNQGNQGQKKQQAQQSLKKNAGDQMRKASSARRLEQGRDAVDQAKRFVRHEGGGGENEERRKQQQEAFAKAARGDKQRNGGEPTMLVEGEVGEGDPTAIMEGQGSESSEGQGNGEGQGEGEGEGGEGQGDGGEREGQGRGDGMGQGSTDPLGAEEGMDVNTKAVRVNADKGRGATRAQTIADSSQQGFATESYRRVYADYKNFAQSALDGETLPVGQRRRVKRYFQMIQPRDRDNAENR